MSNTYRTSDLSLAAYLTLKGHSLTGVSTGNNIRSTFLFKDADGLHAEAMRFVNCKAKVEPSLFMNQIKCLKAMASC